MQGKKFIFQMNIREKIWKIPSFIRVYDGIRITDVIILVMILMITIKQYQIFKISRTSPEIVSMDVRKLSTYVAKDIGLTDFDNSSGTEERKKILLDVMRTTLQDTAKFNNLIILPSDVMIAGEIRDITDIVLHAFEKGE